VSGWTWSDETGATITPELESSWAAYVRIHRDAKPFKHNILQVSRGFIPVDKGYAGKGCIVARETVGTSTASLNTAIWR